MVSGKLPLRFLVAALCGALVFLLCVARMPDSRQGGSATLDGDVVMHPALLTLLYGGDPFLAANVEAARVTTSGRLLDQKSLDFVVRLQESVSRLNACHEDNYYLASAFLSWGGALAPAERILAGAAKCRFWDAWPVFMMGFNQYFFAHDKAGGAAALDEAARRSSGKEASFFSSLAISFRAASFDDLGAAIRYLKAEQARTKDQALQLGLGRRIQRLEGLALLRKAQDDYQHKFRRPLLEPGDLLSAGLLKEFPVDPLGVGYVFNDRRFELRQIAMPVQGN